MQLTTILLNSIWAALFATGLGLLLTAPLRYLVPTFMCGFAGRFVRDILMGWGLGQDWLTLAAAGVIVVIAVAVTYRHSVPPVVLICGVLPLSAAAAMFNVILALMKVSSLEGEALNSASGELTANIGKAFTGTLAIALGLGVGMALVSLFRSKDAED